MCVGDVFVCVVLVCVCVCVVYMCVCVCAGGTDIVSCFMGQNPTVPVYRGEIQTRNLGMAVEAWASEGENTHTHIYTHTQFI